MFESKFDGWQKIHMYKFEVGVIFWISFTKFGVVEQRANQNAYVNEAVLQRQFDWTNFSFSRSYDPSGSTASCVSYELLYQYGTKVDTVCKRAIAYLLLPMQRQPVIGSSLDCSNQEELLDYEDIQ